MDLIFSTSDFPGITNPVIYRAYESTNPTVVVQDSGNIPAPHNAPQNIIIPGVNPIPHIVRCYELPPGATLGILKKEFWIDPTFKNYNGEEVRFYIADGGLTNDPVAGVRIINDTYLDQKRYTVERRARGTLVYEEGLNVRDEYVQVSGGGFQINDPNDVFTSGEVICVRIQARISSAVPIATSVSLFQDILTIDTDTDFSIVEYRKKLINIASATTRILVKLPLAATVADNIVIPFISASGLHINAIIQCQGLDKIYWNRDLYSELYLGIDQELWLTKKGSYYYVVKSSDMMMMRGTRINSYTLNIPNTIFPQGQLKERADYPGIMRFLNDNPLLLVNEANWADTVTVNGVVRYKNKGFFTMGTTATNFRFPDWRNMFFRTVKSLTGDTEKLTQGIGGMGASKLEGHRHFNANGSSETGNPGLDPNKSISFQNETGGIGDFKYTLAGRNQEPTIGFSSKNTESDGTETRPDHYTEYSLMVI